MVEAPGITVEKILGYFEGVYNSVVAKDCSLSVLLNEDLLEALTMQKH